MYVVLREYITAAKFEGIMTVCFLNYSTVQQSLTLLYCDYSYTALSFQAL